MKLSLNLNKFYLEKLFKNLSFQILLAILLGAGFGYLLPKAAVQVKPLADIFINAIKMVIAPIIFLTVVAGIGNISSMKKLGRVGGKALLYFEIVTTFALLIGVFIANVTQPGKGIDVSHFSVKAGEEYIKKAEEPNWLNIFTHIVPSNIFQAFAEGEILQILFFAILFGISVNHLGEPGKKILSIFEKLSSAFFGVLSIIMKAAPIGAFAGMAFTIGKFGPETIKNLAFLMLTVYCTMLIFIFVILNLIAKIYGFSLWKLLVFIKEEILLVFGTSSSESALPRIMDKLEKLGCSKSIVGLVIPTGYSFNLDGTTIYLSMAVIFLTQAFNVQLSLTQQFSIILILMITSKGAAGVTGSGFIVLASTLTALKLIPVEGIALLLGVDRFMSEARAITNVIGNTVATVVISKSENEFHPFVEGII